MIIICARENVRKIGYFLCSGGVLIHVGVIISTCILGSATPFFVIYLVVGGAVLALFGIRALVTFGNYPTKEEILKARINYQQKWPCS
jgi:hypothetical protein